MQKIMIDTGMVQRVDCRGRAVQTVRLIGDALARELETRGMETMTSCGVPELSEEGAGRPSRCAQAARSFGADCLLRLYVRAAADPLFGSADAMVFRRNSAAGEIARSLLQSLETGAGMRNDGIRPAPGVVLLRRTPCPCVILILRLPYREKEFPTEDCVHRYALALANGLEAYRPAQGRG